MVLTPHTCITQYLGLYSAKSSSPGKTFGSDSVLQGPTELVSLSCHSIVHFFSLVGSTPLYSGLRTLLSVWQSGQAEHDALLLHVRDKMTFYRQVG